MSAPWDQFSPPPAPALAAVDPDADVDLGMAAASWHPFERVLIDRLSGSEVLVIHALKTELDARPVFDDTWAAERRAPDYRQEALL